MKSPGRKVIRLKSISQDPPTDSVLVVAGSSGIFESRSSAKTEGIILPGSMHIQEVWVIESSCSTLFSFVVDNLPTKNCIRARKLRLVGGR